MALRLNEESWIWYALAMALVVCRVLSRTIFFGNLKNLKIDDWLMVVTVAPYTVLLVVINIVAHTSSNLLEPGTNLATMSQEERDERVYGSKLILVVEQMQLVTIWLVKACLIILYHRLTLNLPAHTYVKILAVYVGVSFGIMEILYLGVWCRPFSNYWALPTPNIQCSAATNHLITNAVFNLSSDIIMLAIGCSLFIRSNLPWSRKLILTAIFGVGVFVILAAVLNKYYSFSNPFGSQWTYWYVRESSTAIIVANLPFLWTLLRRMFKLDAFDAERYSQHSVPYHSSRSARGRHATKSPRHSHSNGTGNPFNGSVCKHGSQDSSINLTRLELHQITTNTTGSVSKAPPKATHQPSWREQGVFGRGDQELMADIEPFDFADGVDSTLPSPRSSRRNSVPIAGTNRLSRQSISSGASSPTRAGASSPGLRKMRDEEAQYKIQEEVGEKFHFYDGPPESEEEEVESPKEQSRKSSTYEGKDLEFETSVLEPGLQPAQRPAPVLQKSDRSERRRSIVNKVAPPLWSSA